MFPLLRTAILRRGPSAALRAAPRAGPSPCRTIARRYATSHGKSSQGELPWIVGSLAFTVPAVLYLLSGSSSSESHDHGHKPAQVTVPPPAEPATKPEPTTAPREPDVEGTLTAINSAITAHTGADTSDQTIVNATKHIIGSLHSALTDADEAESDLVVAIRHRLEDPHSDPAPLEKAIAALLQPHTKLRDFIDKSKESAAHFVDMVTPDHPLDTPPEQRNPRQEREAVIAAANIKDAGPPRDTIPAGTGPEAAAKDESSQNEISGKQAGVSNTTTFHSVMHSPRGQEISKKAEGVHETSKIKGTVDPEREGS